ncbi:MAG: hypothetical protein AAGL17_12380 [Cyanobacteria bacterium J06576_12]
MKFQITLLLFVLATLHLFGQQTIVINNPSFEDIPGHSREPRGWTDCGWPTESPPDIQPDETFQITKPAFEGNTYLGMVTRDNDTWESIGTRLSSPLAQGKCYAFQIALAQSESYYSMSRARKMPANYIAPVRLKIWGGNSPCELQELLVETEDISHKDWRVYTFNLQPKHYSYPYLVFSVNYTDQTIQPTNGNLLLDAASDIVPNEGCNVPETLGFRGENRIPTEPLILFLPAADALPSQEDAIKLSVENALSSINFMYEDGRAVLLQDEFKIDGDPDIKQGSPFLYEVQHILQSQPHRWELVVFDDNRRLSKQKVAALEAGLSSEIPTDILVSVYNAKTYRDVSWYAKSVKKGFYLRKIED